ncbi:copper resistance CopC family protein [Homoserinimonas sp. OAct 916]|uniref:copper resistance CopC family protein n=1 Tax=Homoserinimonas sp. OAct 916 TaxID=2211450 RepID=UPI000DBE8007|nr:copper resistance CopC family protein [Homoserinimonas sp. OAct 916]
MTRSRTRRPAARMALVAAAAFFTFAAAGLDASAAQAHDQILEQTPTDATHVALVPDEVTVLFSNDLIEVGAVMLVVDTNEVDWADGPVQLRGPIAAQPLKPNTPDGAYTVRWRVVSSDGHPISGAFSFTAGNSAPSQAQQPTAAITPP